MFDNAAQREIRPFLLRQFKIVKSTRQPGKKQTSFEKKNQRRLCMWNARETTKIRSTSFINKGNAQEGV
jgi:hypothetical protein